jgi:hypothetical protein
MREREDPADRRLEHELEEMQEQSDHLEEEVEEARKDWERKQRDSGVPGATGDPES